MSDTEVEFQDVILAVSEALVLGQGYDLSAEEVQALMLGFKDMSETISNAALVVEDAERKLDEASKKRLWRP